MWLMICLYHLDVLLQVKMYTQASFSNYNLICTFCLVNFEESLPHSWPRFPKHWPQVSQALWNSNISSHMMQHQVMFYLQIFIAAVSYHYYHSLLVSVAITAIGSSSDLSQKCGEHAIPALCYNAFPLCDNSGPVPRPRQLCREDCEILENDLCQTEYLLARTHTLIGEW